MALYECVESTRSLSIKSQNWVATLSLIESLGTSLRSWSTAQGREVPVYGVVAVVFAVKKLHQFLYGRHFKIYTDHKPLFRGLLNPERATPLMASSRMQRWALTLQAYEYELLCRPDSENGNADVLSCLLLLDVPETTPVPGDIVHLLETINTSPLDVTKVKMWTVRNPVLSQVLPFVLQGWPVAVEEDTLKPYFVRRGELSVHAGCLLVKIPPQGRDEVLNILHDSHPGIVKMKSLATSYIWWPKMDWHLEGKVRSCATSQSHQKIPPPLSFAVTPLRMAWPPLVPSSRGLCGPFYGQDVLADH